MRRNILHIIYITVFSAALILAVIAFIQNLRPIISVMNSQKRMAGVPTTSVQLDNLTNALKPYKKFAFIFSAMYIPAILFFAYMVSLRILATCKKQMPKLVLPVVAAVNSILLSAALFMADNVGGGLGLAEKFENAANYYSWYNAPVFTAGSNVYYFAPTFYTIIMPLLFLGILPLITGLKTLFTKDK
jgi:hypothetical protein